MNFDALSAAPGLMLWATYFLRKAVATKPTSKRFDVKVRSNMIPERAMIVEIGAALITDVRYLASVHAHMILEIGRPNRRVCAMRTGV